MYINAHERYVCSRDNNGWKARLVYSMCSFSTGKCIWSLWNETNVNWTSTRYDFNNVCNIIYKIKLGIETSNSTDQSRTNHIVCKMLYF